MQDIIKAKTITKLIEANYYYLKMLDRHSTQSHKQPQQQLPEETPKRAREASASYNQAQNSRTCCNFFRSQTIPLLQLYLFSSLLSFLDDIRFRHEISSASSKLLQSGEDSI